MKKSNHKKKICIFTTSRADYGLLRTFIKKISHNLKFNSYVIATGSHLEKKNNYTYKEIEQDGIKIFAKINLSIKNDTAKCISKSIAIGLVSFNKVLEKINPDLIIILGDRFEILPICYSALFLNIPIAHFNGGESTEGSTDELIRHSVTKLSHLHFPANKIYSNRIINMGESPNRVFNVGGTSIDNIKNTKLLSKKYLEKFLNFRFKEKNFLITYHPATLNPTKSLWELKNLLKVLLKYKKYGLIFTGTNIDIKSNKIKKMIINFIKKNKNSIFIESMGSTRYISSMRLCDIIIGNSSSGILEAPFFKKPVVNIGDRQKGRLKAKNIISCDGSLKSINKSLEKCLNSKFIESIKKFKNPYGNGNASIKAINIIEKINFNKILEKKFYERSKNKY